VVLTEAPCNVRRLLCHLCGTLWQVACICSNEGITSTNITPVRGSVGIPTRTNTADICLRLTSLSLPQSRHFRTSTALQDVPKLRKDSQASTTQFATPSNLPQRRGPEPKPLTSPKATIPDPDAAAANVKAKLKEQENAANALAIKMGDLADNSLFAGEESQQIEGGEKGDKAVAERDMRKNPLSLESRNPNNLAPVLNPRPTARARWQRRMLIRQIRRRGRLTKEMRLARTERTSLSRSHFFKTSMKKLAPLARQIAGKPIDEAILQMRFSAKKVAKDVRKHLIQARDEAIVARGMGLADISNPSSADIETPPSLTEDLSSIPQPSTSFAADPSITPPLPHQNPTKSFRDGHTPDPTSIYIAQAWTNRGPYGRAPDYRAFGRINIMRPPHTGLSVLLKEEKTRTREKMEKEAKAIRRRMGKNMWTQLPDRKIQGPQGQYVLW
jgi:ribosomal protein L22